MSFTTASFRPPVMMKMPVAWKEEMHCKAYPWPTQHCKNAFKLLLTAKNIYNIYNFNIKQNKAYCKKKCVSLGYCFGVQSLLCWTKLSGTEYSRTPARNPSTLTQQTMRWISWGGKKVDVEYCRLGQANLSSVCRWCVVVRDWFQM